MPRDLLEHFVEMRGVVVAAEFARGFDELLGLISRSCGGILIFAAIRHFQKPKMHQRNLIIYCDESAEKGRYFSHFYGGALLNAIDKDRIEADLNKVKTDNNLGAELKWTKITHAYADKYIAFLDAFFNLVAENDIKIRIMFTQNSNEPTGLEDHQIDNQYWLLYYQLIKHAFGMIYCGETGIKTDVSLFLDDIPDNDAAFKQFAAYISSLSAFPNFISQRVNIRKDNITDVNSKSHVILQGLDIILGAMQFRLNDMHLAIPEGKKRRAKRTVAKERVYRFISQRIRQIYPNFNIGVSTATSGDIANRWHHPYRHWLFVPSEHRVKTGIGKKRNAAKKR